VLEIGNRTLESCWSYKVFPSKALGYSGIGQLGFFVFVFLLFLFHLFLVFDFCLFSRASIINNWNILPIVTINVSSSFFIFLLVFEVIFLVCFLRYICKVIEMRQLLSKFLTALFSFKSVLVKFKPLSRLELRVSEEIKVGIFICSVLNPAILGALLPYVFAFYFGSLYFFFGFGS